MSGLSFSPDGRFLVAFVRARFVCWDLGTQKEVCNVDVADAYLSIHKEDREVHRLRDRLGVLHCLPESNRWLALGCVIIEQDSGTIQTVVIPQRVIAGQMLPGFESRVVPGLRLLQPFLVKEERVTRNGVMFAEIETGN